MKKFILVLNSLVAALICGVLVYKEKYIESAIFAGLLVLFAYLFQNLKVKNVSIDLDDKSLSINRDENEK